jgi:hypothetical protein
MYCFTRSDLRKNIIFSAAGSGLNLDDPTQPAHQALANKQHPSHCISAWWMVGCGIIRIYLWLKTAPISAADGGGGKHGAITTDLPIHARLSFVRSCTTGAAVQEDLRGALANAKSARRASSSSPSPSVRQACQGQGGGRAQPRTTRAAFGKGAPAFSGSRGLSHRAREAQTERRSSEVPLNTTPEVFVGLSNLCIGVSDYRTLALLDWLNISTLWF